MLLLLLVVLRSLLLLLHLPQEAATLAQLLVSGWRLCPLQAAAPGRRLLLSLRCARCCPAA
jgi:hypothetical protein